jgi:proteasome lid subunit RPN8/RPN11
MAADKKDKDKKVDDADVTVKDRSSKKPHWGKFPGPAGAKAPLRVAMDKDAYAAITAHAAESLDAEICGILAGTLCEDDNGYFLQVTASVRGDAARKGGTHVTFTHETWDAIHKTMEKEHPKLDIVGWYHSHPGFGVEFSEMDLFIQKNFFAANTQVALVTDPLGGQTAMCLQTDNGVKYIGRFWVDGREMKCQMPGGSSAKASDDDDDDQPSAAASPEMKKALENMEKRLTQALQAIDDQRQWIYRTITTFGMFIATLAIFGIGYFVYKTWAAPYTPPQLNQTVPVPVMINGKPAMIQMGVVGWDIPPDVNATYIQIEKERRAQLEAAAKQAAATQPSPAPTTQPIGK